MIRPTVALLALLSLAAAAPAQLTEAQATAQLKAALKTARIDHAQAVAQRVEAAVAGIDAFLADFPNGLGPAFLDLFDAIEDFQNGLFDDFRVHHDIAITAAIDALTAFADGAALEGSYPEAFYFGFGGPLDDLRVAMEKAQAKGLAKVRKKLEKAAGKVAKAVDARIAIHLEPATRQGRSGFVQGVQTGYTGEPLVIHTVLALGHKETNGSGTILIGGVGSDDETITVRAVAEGGLSQVDAEFFELGSPFWHATLNDGGSGFADGNVLVHALQGVTGQSFAAFVGVQ